MNTKFSASKLVIFLFVLISTTLTIRLYAQDTLATSKTISEAKLELLEYNQKILEARMKLMETNVSEQEVSPKKGRVNRVLIKDKEMYKVAPDTSIKPFTQAITFNITRIFEGTMQLGYERALKDNLSLDVNMMGTYVTRDGFGKGYLASQELAYNDAVTDSYINFNGSMIRSIGGIVRLKNYLLTRINRKTKAPIGLYAAPQLMYRRVWITGNQYVYDYNYFAVPKEITRNLDIMQGGVILGSKFAVAGVLCVDVYIGGVMRLSKYYNEPTFTKYKRWNNIDYSGILPTAGINIGILK